METQAYRQAVEHAFPQIQIRTCTPNQEGWVFFVLDINDEFIFRFPRREDGVAQLEKEIALLPELGKSLSVQIPHFEFVWRGDNQFPMPFVGYRKIEGVPLTRSYLASADAERLEQQLAAFLSKLHFFPVEQAVRTGIPATNAAQWRQQYIELYRRIRADAFPLLAESLRSSSSELWDEFLDERNFDFATTLIHRDLAGEHILCRTDGTGLAGIIDWGDACMGDPAIDFAGLWSECGHALVERVAAGYRGNADTRFYQRMRFYARIIPFWWILYGQSTNDASKVQEGLRQLRED